MRRNFNFLLFTGLAASVLLMLSSCGIAHYKDHDIDVWDFRVGTDRAFDGLQYGRNKDGTQFQVRGFNENQTEGMKQINQGLSLIFEGLAKGAVEGVKP